MSLDKKIQKEEILCKGSDNSMKLCDFGYLGEVVCPYRLEESGQCRYRPSDPIANVEIKFRKPILY